MTNRLFPNLENGKYGLVALQTCSTRPTPAFTQVAQCISLLAWYGGSRICRVASKQGLKAMALEVVAYLICTFQEMQGGIRAGAQDSDPERGCVPDVTVPGTAGWHQSRA